jgi:hypothetical protein
MTGKVTNLQDWLKRKRAASDALMQLMNPPPTPPAAPPDAPPPERIDPAAVTFFKKGAGDGFSGRPHKAPQACKGPEYAFGYLEGYVWQRLRMHIDWPKAYNAVLGKGFDDGEKSALSAHRPRRVAKRIRDMTFNVDIMLQARAAEKKTGKYPAVEEIVAAAAERFGISTRTAWNIYGDDDPTLEDAVDWIKMPKGNHCN